MIDLYGGDNDESGIEVETEFDNHYHQHNDDGGPVDDDPSEASVEVMDASFSLLQPSGGITLATIVLVDGRAANVNADVNQHHNIPSDNVISDSTPLPNNTKVSSDSEIGFV